MSEIGDIFKAHKEERREKRWRNVEASAQYLELHKVPFESHNGGLHLVVAEKYDFWPSTGRFINRKTKKSGRGVFNLVKRLNEHRP